jgi:hypothetical protein
VTVVGFGVTVVGDGVFGETVVGFGVTVVGQGMTVVSVTLATQEGFALTD